MLTRISLLNEAILKNAVIIALWGIYSTFSDII